MGKHTRYVEDPLRPLNEPTWLVVQDVCSQPLVWRQLGPMADQRAALEAVRTTRAADGWAVEEIGPRCSFFFCERAGVRESVHIMRSDPAGPKPLGHGPVAPAPPLPANVVAIKGRR